MTGDCKLCGTSGELKLSHIVPAFVYRWLKESSGTGFLRSGINPNRRAQDGLKDHWLCSNCEGLFSKCEASFAKEIFYPVAEKAEREIRYGDWLLKFSVSMSWRVLSYIQEYGNIDHLSSGLVKTATDAREKWASFLLGHSPHPAQFEQHIILLDEIASHKGGDLPPNINRYLLRTVDIDVAGSESDACVFVKLPHIILIGAIGLPGVRKWSGTKIHVRKGVAGRGRTEVSSKLFEFIVGRARNMQAMHDQISGKQRDKIDKSFKNNEDLMDQTGSFKAMAADIRLFGVRAFGDYEDS